MIIGIDASRSVKTIQKTGVEKVSDELLQEITKLKNKEKEITFIFYTPQEISWLPKQNQRILSWPFKFFWTQFGLGWELIFHPPEHMFFPAHAMPLALLLNSKTSYYKIIHDIAFKKQPQLYSLKQRFILNLDLLLAQKISTKIFVPTEAVRQDLIKQTSIKQGKIVVVPWGYKRFNSESEIVNYAPRKKQILYIGRIEEKKNINNLIKGFQLFNKEHPDYKLILAGKVDNKFPISNFQFPNNFQNPKSKSHNMIEFLGFVSEGKKHELLLESAVLVLVSKEEGFGFPILEAFDFGLPVIVSNIPVLREIGGDNCLYVNPDLPADIAHSLEIIITDEHLSSSLITAGHERLKEFDWHKATERILREILSS